MAKKRVKNCRCIIRNCLGMPYARGLCKRHYSKKWRESRRSQAKKAILESSKDAALFAKLDEAKRCYELASSTPARAMWRTRVLEQLGDPVVARRLQLRTRSDSLVSKSMTT